MFQEKECILAYKNGDHFAFEELYHVYFQKIYNFVFYKVQNREETEDIVSDVFHKVIQNIQQFDEKKGAFSAWIYGIARNAVVDFFRGHHTKENIDDIFDLQSSDDVEKEVAHKLRLESVEHYLQSLDSFQREILILRIWEDLSYKEIADIVGKKESAVKMTFSRALKKIQKHVFLFYFILLYS